MLVRSFCSPAARLSGEDGTEMTNICQVRDMTGKWPLFCRKYICANRGHFFGTDVEAHGGACR